MCGIVGYVGQREASPIVLAGLKRLEYRGYDSAGLAAIVSGTGGSSSIKIKRCEGKLENLVRSLETDPVHGTNSIGHTRWATHGRPSEKNAHPHRYKDVVIVHNGIIENYASLKEELSKKGHVFTSETDSEVIAHRLQFHLEKGIGFEEACKKLVNDLKGAFALAALWAQEPRKLFVAKHECPMVLGLGKDEQFIASDIPALLEYTRDFIFLNDQEMAFVTPDQIVLKNFAGKVVQKKPHHIEWSFSAAEKEGYPHYMLKEIHEQPRAIRDTLRGRIQPKLDGVIFDQVPWTKAKWKSFDSSLIVACGTAFHAGLIGKYWIERLARVHVEVDLGSEFRYRNPIVPKKTFAVAISQSGETADTLAALNEALRLKLPSLAITNTVQSSIVRKAKNVIYTHAGPEVAVASTKCFVSQLSTLALLALHLADVRGILKKSVIKKYLQELAEVPEHITEVLKLNDHIHSICKEYSKFDQYFYLGRGLSYPIALEGALKLKEIAYINTQAYPSGEMKHGPIALISDQWPILCVAPEAKIMDKMITNIQEVKARGGRPIIVGPEGHSELQSLAEAYIPIPKVRDEWAPFLSTVALQLYSYHMSVLRGCDVDKPKNLAKSVTVE